MSEAPIEKVGIFWQKRIRLSPLRNGALLNAVLLFFLISCGKKTETGAVLARVDQATISQRQYEWRLKNLMLLTPLDNAQMREALLQAMLDEQVLLVAADHRGFRETEEFKRRAEHIRTDAILEAYRDSIADTVTVREAEVVEAFALANEQAAARHLFAPTLAEANALYEKLQNGATFEELAPKIFKDYRLASSGGYLGYFKWDDMDPTFSAAAQKLQKGEISKPVRTKFGYSIIKLEERVRSPILTEAEYIKESKKLRWKVEHRRRAQAIQQLDAKTLAALQIRFNEATLAQMWDKMQSLRADSARELEDGVALAALSLSAEVARIGEQTWTIKDFQERAAQTSARQRNRVQSVEDLKDFISGLALREVYLRRVKRAGFENDPKVQPLIRSKEESFLIEKMKSLLTASVAVPEDSLRFEYAAQPQKYAYPAMVRLREITLANRRQAEHIINEAKRGQEFGALAKRYSIRQWSAARGGEVGYVTKGDVGVLADEIFRLKPGEIGGPYEHDEYFSIVQVLDAKPSQPKTFAEARAEIEENLLPIYKQRELQKQLQSLRQPLTITVDRQVLQQVQSPLENSPNVK
jgi:parvulin-like peptidyl-prolyl isomerase